MKCLYVCYYEVGGCYGVEVWSFPQAYIGRRLHCNESYMLIDAWWD